MLKHFSAEHNGTQGHKPAMLLEGRLREKCWDLATLRHSPSAAPEGNVLVCSHRNWHSPCEAQLLQMSCPFTAQPGPCTCLMGSTSADHWENILKENVSVVTKSRGAGAESWRLLYGNGTSLEQMPPSFLLLRGDQGGCLILLFLRYSQ
jgi:hypothetical protein